MVGYYYCCIAVLINSTCSKSFSHEKAKQDILRFTHRTKNAGELDLCELIELEESIAHLKQVLTALSPKATCIKVMTHKNPMHNNVGSSFLCFLKT